MLVTLRLTDPQVLHRIKTVMNPLKNQFLSNIKSKGDLYGATAAVPSLDLTHYSTVGPFWISTTLVFVVAMVGNIVRWHQSQSGSFEWSHDFSKGSVA